MNRYDIARSLRKVPPLSQLDENPFKTLEIHGTI